MVGHEAEAQEELLWSADGDDALDISTQSGDVGQAVDCRRRAEDEKVGSQVDSERCLCGEWIGGDQ